MAEQPLDNQGGVPPPEEGHVINMTLPPAPPISHHAPYDMTASALTNAPSDMSVHALTLAAHAEIVQRHTQQSGQSVQEHIQQQLLQQQLNHQQVQQVQQQTHPHTHPQLILQQPQPPVIHLQQHHQHQVASPAQVESPAAVPSPAPSDPRHTPHPPPVEDQPQELTAARQQHEHQPLTTIQEEVAPPVSAPPTDTVVAAPVVAQKSNPAEAKPDENRVAPIPITIPIVKQEVIENGDDDDIEEDISAEKGGNLKPILRITKEMLLEELGETIADLDLTAVEVESWLVFQKKSFDVKVFEEPFHGIRLLFNTDTGHFIHRIWGKTKTKGEVDTVKALTELMTKVYYQILPCLGYFDFQNGFSMSRDDFVAVEFPIPRVISKDCLFSYQLTEESNPTVPELLGIGLCSMCLGVNGAPAAKAKKEPCSDGEEVEDDDEEDEDGESEDGDCAMIKEEDPSWSDAPDEDDDDDYRPAAKLPRTSINAAAAPKVKKKRGRKPKYIQDEDLEERHKRITLKKNGKKVYHCGECNKDFNQPRSLDKHRETYHMFGSFYCPHCHDFHVRLANEMYQHIVCQHPEVEFKCMSCNEVTFGRDKEREFSVHYKACFKIKERADRRSKRVPLTKEEEEKKRPHMCDLCGKTFAARTTFMEHKNWHKGLKPIKCPDCDFRTCFSTSLYTHSKIHMRERGLEKMENDIPLVYPCEICGNKYNQANQLRTHIKRIHEGVVEERECDQCHQVFTNRQNLRRHQARAHPKDPSLQCKICGHVCADRYAFQLHQRVHSEPNFMCRFCGKAVKSKQTLQAHERSHTGENPYQCEMCEYACKSSSVLNRHKQAKHNLQPGTKPGPPSGRVIKQEHPQEPPLQLPLPPALAAAAPPPQPPQELHLQHPPAPGTPLLHHHSPHPPPVNPGLPGQ